MKRMLFLVTGLLFSFQAFAGPGDGGGGGIETKSREQILAAVSQLPVRLANAFHRFEVYHTLVQAAEDDSAHPLPNGGVPKAIFGLMADGKIQQVVAAVQIVPQEAACKDPHTGEAKDGSLNDHTMCLSLSRLSVWPAESFERELLAVAAHELSHARGYNETQAKAVYQEFLDSDILKYNVKPIEVKFVELHSIAARAMSGLKRKDWTLFQRHLDVQPLVTKFAEIQAATPRLLQIMLKFGTTSNVKSEYGDWTNEVDIENAAASIATDSSTRKHLRPKDIIVAERDLRLILANSRRAIELLGRFDQVRPTDLFLVDMGADDLGLQFDVSTTKTPIELGLQVRCEVTNPDGTKSSLGFSTQDHQYVSPVFNLLGEQDRNIPAILNIQKEGSHGSAFSETAPLIVGLSSPSNMILKSGSSAAQDSSTWVSKSNTKLTVLGVLAAGSVNSVSMTVAASAFVLAPNPKHLYRIDCHLPAGVK